MELLAFSCVLVVLTVLAVNGVLRVLFESSLFVSYREALAAVRTARTEPAENTLTPQEIAEAGVILAPANGWYRVLGRLPTFVLDLLSCEYCTSHWLVFACYTLFTGPAVFFYLQLCFDLAYAFAAMPAVFGAIELRRLLQLRLGGPGKTR